MSNSSFTELLVIIFGLFFLQATYGGYAVLLNSILDSGVDSIFLVTANSLFTVLLFLPFALLFERSKWPEKVTSTLLLQIVLIAAGEKALEVLTFVGIELTNATVSASITNLAPGLTFVIAVCVRYEVVDMKSVDSIAKMVGTLVCLLGVTILTLTQDSQKSPVKSLTATSIDIGWIVGCLILLFSVIVMSATLNLKAMTMKTFPAPMTLCALTSLVGAAQTTIIQIVAERKFGPVSTSIGLGLVLAYALLGGVLLGTITAFQTWSIKKRGPVLASMFNPVATVSAAIFSAIFLKKFLSWGSFAGIMIMFVGLYLVLWAKSKEYVPGEDDEEIDVENVKEVKKPLLS